MGQLYKLLHLITNVKIEEKIALLIFLTMTALPIIETVTRFFNINSIPASQILVQHLTLWIGFVGAVLAAKQNKLEEYTYNFLLIHLGQFSNYFFLIVFDIL